MCVGAAGFVTATLPVRPGTREMGGVACSEVPRRRRVGRATESRVGVEAEVGRGRRGAGEGRERGWRLETVARGVLCNSASPQTPPLWRWVIIFSFSSVQVDNDHRFPHSDCHREGMLAVQEVIDLNRKSECDITHN